MNREVHCGHTLDGDQVVVIEREHPLSGYEAWIEHGSVQLLLRQLHPDLVHVLRASLAPASTEWRAA